MVTEVGIIDMESSKKEKEAREREDPRCSFCASFRNDSPARKVFILVLKDLDSPELQPQNYWQNKELGADNRSHSIHCLPLQFIHRASWLPTRVSDSEPKFAILKLKLYSIPIIDIPKVSWGAEGLNWEREERKRRHYKLFLETPHCLR